MEVTRTLAFTWTLPETPSLPVRVRTKFLLTPVISSYTTSHRRENVVTANIPSRRSSSGQSSANLLRFPVTQFCSHLVVYPPLDYSSVHVAVQLHLHFLQINVIELEHHVAVRRKTGATQGKTLEPLTTTRIALTQRKFETTLRRT
jgi:hypothetical protein